MSLLRYSAAFSSWRKFELQAIDRKTKKLFTVYGGLHRKSDVDSLYIPRRDGGRGLIEVEDCVELAVRGLEVYGHETEERLLQAARGDKVDGLEAASILKKTRKKKRLQDWQEKKADESIDHLVSGCGKLAQKEYKRRHDNLGKIAYWKLARKYNFEAGDKWYERVMSQKVF